MALHRPAPTDVALGVLCVRCAGLQVSLLFLIHTEHDLQEGRNL